MQSNHRLLIILILSILTGAYVFKQMQPLSPASSQAKSAQENILLSARFNALDGSEQALNQWQGNILVLNFWATWCPPCREEMPELSRMHDQYKNQKIIVIGLSTDDLETTKTYIKTNPVSYPVLAGDMQAMNFSESLGNTKGVLPYTVVVDERGKVIKTFFGRVNQPLLEKTLLPLLKNHASSN